MSFRILFTIIMLAASGLSATARCPRQQGMDITDSHGCGSEILTRRPIHSEYNIEWGWMNATSSYLSPLPYSGKELAISGRWSKIFNHFNNRAIMAFDTRISAGSMLNPARSAEMLAATFDFGWGLAWKPQLPCGWEASVGGRAGIYAGALYLTRNSNNPVTAIAAPGLDITASAAKTFRLGRLPVTISDRVRLPFLSMFFCPQFGETYYEIWLGNRKGLIHCGWWGNAPGVDNNLQARLHFGKRSLILGWRFEYRRFEANHLFTSIRNSVFSIGIDF